MDLEQELEAVKLKIAELEEWDFGVRLADDYFDSLPEKMWGLEAQIKENP